MGYTHYWSYDPNLNQGRLRGALFECKRYVSGVSQLKGIVVAGWDGTGKPTITAKKISLNGDGRHDLDHETFLFPFPKKEEREMIKWHPDAGGRVWGFCKTARKPYDIVVCGCLLILKHHLGWQMRIDSDGGHQEDEWIPAERQVKLICGINVKFKSEKTI